jgi:DNA (cytosine-5)-methyltransferase 1
MVEHWFRTDIYFSIPDKDIWMQLKTMLNIETNEFDESIMTFIEKESVFEKSNRVYDEDGIAPTLTSTSADERILVTLTLAQGRAGSSDEYMDSVSKIAKLQGVIRRLTPIECERLQTVKDNYTAHVSDSQRYKMLGNGWTIEVIAHIFSFINI